ncbi:MULTISPECIES: cytochrome P450 [unclassified Variovorax]|uniref:cytochrome P450 n=1 Tax=unclassified Variovorax TaxID=663243 RepID=UPI001BD65596|nr:MULTISPECIES: cytochrome P450 [unclassified Variovorax]
MDSPTLDKPITPPQPAPRQIADLPGPRGIPLLGNLLQLDPPRMHQQLEQWCKEFGPFFKLKVGRSYLLIVGDHQAVAAMLRDRPDGFKRTTRLEKVGQEMGLKPGVFGANDDDWRRQRRMVMAGFDPAHVKGYFPSLQGVADRLARRWQKAARDGSAIDLQADLMRYTVDTIAGLAFGAEVNTLETDGDVIQQHLDKIFPALLKRMLSPLPTWRWFPTQADRQLARGVVAVNEAVDGFVAQARVRMQADPALRTHPRNLLEAMIAAADEPDSGITDAQVSGNVMTMLLAGEDTTANTIAWMIDLLWRHPDALARATAEVRRVVGDTAQPTFEQMAQLDFVEACAHETMRLRPVAPILGLQAKKDVIVGDIQVPAGTVVVNLMRRDGVSEGHVPRAAAFEPQRWMADGGPGAMASSARRTSMPFGAGPRICPGRYLALLEIKMAMAVLLSRFDIAAIDTPDGQPARELLAFTMTPVGLRMRLRECAS